jgi:hypothetical protein
MLVGSVFEFEVEPDSDSYIRECRDVSNKCESDSFPKTRKMERNDKAGMVDS